MIKVARFILVLKTVRKKQNFHFNTYIVSMVKYYFFVSRYDTIYEDLSRFKPDLNIESL